MIHRIKNILDVLRADQHMREVAGGTILAFALKLSGSALAFAFNVALARLLGANGAGLYFLALAVTTVGSVIGRMGLDNSLLRFVAIHATHQEWGKVQGVFALGMRLAIVMAGLVTMVTFLAAPWIAATIFNRTELAEPLRWMSLSILPFVLLNLQAESLKGLNQIRDAMLVQGVGVPLTGLLLIYPLSQMASVTGVVWAYIAGVIMSALLGMFAWRKTISAHEASTVRFPFQELWASCKPLFLASIINRAVFPWASLFLLGIWAPAEEVGIFGAAFRLAMLVTLVLVTVNNVLAPKFAALYAKGDISALRLTARRSALLISILGSPFLLLFIFGGRWVMGIYGPEFEQGAPLLMILAAGQFVNLLTGSVGYLLMMSGNEISYRNVNLISALVLAGLCVFLIPSYGAVGAAIANSVSIAFLNILALVIVVLKLRALESVN